MIEMLELEELLAKAKDYPLYRNWDFSGVEKFGDIAWQRLPTLSSGDIRLHSRSIYKGKSEVVFFSSGTTNSPKMVVYNLNDLDRVAELCARFGRLEGVSSLSRVMVLLPMALWSVGRITVRGHLKIGAQVYPVDLRGDVDHWQRMADIIHPTVISSTPSVLVAWAPHYRGPKLELVETTGEQLLDYERHLIEAAFGGFVFDAYGLTECVVGVECPVRHGFHFWPDATGVEILEPNSNIQVKQGDIGEIVVTSFMQEAMPIIRYRTGDLGWISADPCPCKKGHVLHFYRRLIPCLNLPRGVTLDHKVVHEVFKDYGLSVHIRYKRKPENLVTPFVQKNFKPTLEIEVCGDKELDLEDLYHNFLTSIPEISELIYEDELNLILVKEVNKSETNNKTKVVGKVFPENKTFSFNRRIRHGE